MCHIAITNLLQLIIIEIQINLNIVDYPEDNIHWNLTKLLEDIDTFANKRYEEKLFGKSDNDLRYKCLMKLTPDFLYQYFMFLMGQLFEIRNITLSAKAQSYYLQSFKWEEVEKLDNRLFKRTLKSLRMLNRYNIDKCREFNRLLSKFYVKNKSIQVIMEMCNDDT